MRWHRGVGDRASRSSRCVRCDRRRIRRRGNGAGEASMRKLLRGAFVIGRRDFSATVLSKTFLFFLLGPIFPLLFGVVFGGIGASVANSREKPAVAVVASDDDFAPIDAARNRLAAAIDEDHVVRLVRVDPKPDS